MAAPIERGSEYYSRFIHPCNSIRLEEEIKGGRWKEVVKILKEEGGLLDSAKLTVEPNHSDFGRLLDGVRLVDHEDAETVFQKLLTNQRMDTDLREGEIYTRLFKFREPFDRTNWYYNESWEKGFASDEKTMARSLAFLLSRHAEKIPLDDLKKIFDEWTEWEKKRLLPRAITYGLNEKLIDLPGPITGLISAEVQNVQYMIDRLTSLIQKKEEEKAIAREKRALEEKVGREDAFLLAVARGISSGSGVVRKLEDDIGLLDWVTLKVGREKSDFGDILKMVRWVDSHDADRVFQQLLTHKRMGTDLCEGEISDLFFPPLKSHKFETNDQQPYLLCALDCRTARSIALLQTRHAEKIPLDALKAIRDDWTAGESTRYLNRAVNYGVAIGLVNRPDANIERATINPGVKFVIDRIDHLISLHEKTKISSSDSEQKTLV